MHWTLNSSRITAVFLWSTWPGVKSWSIDGAFQWSSRQPCEFIHQISAESQLEKIYFLKKVLVTKKRVALFNFKVSLDDVFAHYIYFGCNYWWCSNMRQI